MITEDLQLTNIPCSFKLSDMKYPYYLYFMHDNGNLVGRINYMYVTPDLKIMCNVSHNLLEGLIFKLSAGVRCSGEGCIGELIEISVICGGDDVICSNDV